MRVKAGYSTPLLHVSDVERSVRFYALLGFETVDVHHDEGLLAWARVHCEGGAIMFLRAEDSGDAPHDRILLYLYTPDLPALRSELIVQGIEVGPIDYPVYMQSGEICISDPDGYVILIGHWGQQEDDSWEREREEKRAAGLFPTPDRRDA